MKAKTWMMAGGIALIVAGAALLLRIPYFYYHSAKTGAHLLEEANQITQTGGNSTANSASSAGASLSLPKGLLGEVYIPALQLRAPLVEGTDDAQLSVGVGHLKTSVMPGQAGTSVIAAHNATWFRHIDTLKPGDPVEVVTKSGTVTFQVTQHKVVKEGSPVYNSANPTLVLETCYPTNALYLTPYRLLVYADLKASGKPTVGNIPAAVNIYYKTDIPQRIVKQGITLTTNSLPMGTLTYTGNPSDKYVQSNAPLRASAAAVRLYLGWLHASANSDEAALKQLVPDVVDNPFLGIRLNQLSYRQNFSIQLTVNGTVLQKIQAKTEVESGAVYGITVDCMVKGSNVTISNLEVKKVM